MRGKLIAIFLSSCLLQFSRSADDYDYAYPEEPVRNATRKFFFGGKSNNPDELRNHDYHDPSEYYHDDTLPFGKFDEKETLTIEQFVNELKRRKEAKKQQKQKQLKKANASKGNKRVPKNNVKAKKEQAKGTIKQKDSKKSKPSSGRKPKSSSSRPSKSKSQKDNKRNQKKQKSKSGAKQKPRKANTQKSKGSKPTPTKKKSEPKSSIKSKVVSKPSRKQKPFHKPKKDTKHKIKDEEDEDSFQIGNSDSHQHSNHHIHQHDHLEAHKHHHKHKESHDHSHDHSNDHIHNHKHTHNHEHNHIHKHNEAHEHTAEHAHTEKHHHKHLEYIDAGGWRRRNDFEGETIMEGDPSEIVIENRSFGDKEDPKDNVKNYLKKYIQFYKTVSTPDDDDTGTSIEDDDFPENDIKEQKISITFDAPAAESHLTENKDKFAESSQDFQGLSFDESEPFDAEQYQPASQQYEADILKDEEDPDEDAEEITFEEYMALQKKGPSFEEEYEDYDENEGVQFSTDYDGANYSGYEDQIGYGTNQDLVKVDFNNVYAKNNWVPETSELVPIQEMEIDLYDENQWKPQSEFSLERSDQGSVQYTDSEANSPMLKMPGMTENNEEDF